ncbi:hypothetical protein TGAM01_v206288 [Trichoderma gamsii]|uniref:Uncharacterized protein n=1 Tax=Trichoderma gamsii TaxID=398673 RepID=A0A2P4ZKF7_9HYPO|nr:hypothetical protein TGAM01_v206288 [Trichoderma gamsii]PON24780.1 hypothetical protein TGAM01_v206288 [Trichoderma gamsii]
MNITNTAPGLPPPGINAADSGEEENLSDDSMCRDQDDAQAFLQPAMSAAASHLTSLHTPATEKAAALQRRQVVGYFDEPQTYGDDDGDGDTTPEAPAAQSTSLPLPETQLNGKPVPMIGPVPLTSPRRRSPPSPWKSQQATKDGKPFSEARGILHAAFEPTRQRSRSAGQEALKKLQQAFPSHLLPSLPKSLPKSLRPSRSDASRRRGHASPDSPLRNAPDSPSSPDANAAAGSSSSRPPLLRRTTSDDSMLYHSLSRASSLGDDDRFTDVRDMVNVRFMAIKHSLPDVPNFKIPNIPGLAGLQAISRKSTISLNGIFSNESANHSKQNLDSTASKEIPKEIPIDDSERLDRVLEELTGDIVVMGGYRGSILRSAEPPHQQLWAPVKLGLNLRKANLEVGLDDEDEETMEERIFPSGMLQHIGPIDISRKFFKKLRSCENARSGRLRVWDYGYDWRLSPSRSSKRLLDFLRNLPSNQPGVPVESRGAIVVAHSLGGLITRHAVNQQPDLFAGVLFCGTPMRCINILGPMRNGDAVLFNDKLLTAQVNFSIRTSFALLPEDGFLFVDKYTGEEYPVDFFEPENWVKYRLSPCVAPPLPPYNQHPQHSPLAAFFPNALLRPSKSDKRRNSMSGPDPASKDASSTNDSSIPQARASMAPQFGGSNNRKLQNHRHTLSIPPSSQAPFSPDTANLPPSPPSPSIDPALFRRNYEYLTRTLASVKQFRSELVHNKAHQDANAYPPLAVIYGKSIPTVYAAHVNGRDAIPCSDAYDELVFRPGDGVVLARESMLPEGYSIAKGGRVSTDRGHVSILTDMPALGKALGALLRGRRKGIGYGSVSEAAGTPTTTQQAK